MVVRVAKRSQPDADTFRIRVVRSLPVAVVELDGELTLAVAGEVRGTLRTCLAECPDAVVVDLAGLRVASNLPLNAFRAIRRQEATWPAAPVLLCAPSPVLAARLARSGLDRLLPVLPSRAAAVAAVGARPSLARVDLQLPPAVTAPARARELVYDACVAWGVPELIDDARLVVSELVTNAILHTGDRLRLSLVLRDRALHLIVHDRSTDPPRLVFEGGARAAARLGGRGLYLLEITAQSWGHLTTDTGKAVWAVLRRR
jgi:anti-sigma regulatory factor (Ser/Thr protein kinase)/anti-anti-sigma regulatory factor